MRVLLVVGVFVAGGLAGYAVGRGDRGASPTVFRSSGADECPSCICNCDCPSLYEVEQKIGGVERKLDSVGSEVSNIRLWMK